MVHTAISHTQLIIQTVEVPYPQHFHISYWLHFYDYHNLSLFCRVYVHLINLISYRYLIIRLGSMNGPTGWDRRNKVETRSLLV